MRSSPNCRRRSRSSGILRRSEIDGDVIRTDDKRILINSSVTPTLQDKIVDDSVVYSIVNIREVKPGGSTIFYDLQVRV